MSQYIFTTSDGVKRDPKGKALSDYCLADNNAISVEGGDGYLPFATHIARSIVEDGSFDVDSVATQPEIGLTIGGKKVRLDLVVTDADGRVLDLEAQKNDTPSLIDRLTLYTAEIVMRMSDSGRNYGELRDIYVAFVCRDDLLKTGKAVSRIEMRMPDGSPIGCKVHWIVLAHSLLGEPKTEIERLLHDFFCTEEDKMYSKDMRDRLNYLRTEEGIRMMFETREEEIRRKLDEQRKRDEADKETALKALKAENAAEKEAALKALKAENAAEKEAALKAKEAEKEAALKAKEAEKEAEKDAALKALKAENEAEKEAALKAKDAEIDTIIENLLRGKLDPSFIASSLNVSPERVAQIAKRIGIKA